MPVGDGSISLCIGELKAGNEAAVRALLDRYLGPLENYARRKLRRLGASCAVADEQDLAQEAMVIVLDGIRKRKYEDLKDRESLLKLLQFVAWRGALKLKRHQEAGRRSERPVGMASPAVGADVGGRDDPGPDGPPARDVDPTRTDPAAPPRWRVRTEEAVARIAGRERDHEDLFAIREEVRALLSILEDERDRHLLLRKLEGYTHAEIAEEFDCSKRSVSLRFQRIRNTIRGLST